MLKMYTNLDISVIKQRLQSAVIGREIIVMDKTVSTNLDALRLGNEGAKDGTVIIADEQTGGRGRFDRTWLSPPGKNILMSVILRPKIDPGRLFHLTMIASLAVTRAIRDVTGITAMIKWPNDVYAGQRKVCGILTELRGAPGASGFAVVGIGINVNAHPELGDSGAAPATSLAAEKGVEISRIDIISVLLQEMDRRYHELLQGCVSSIVKDWTSQSLVLGKEVRVSDLDWSINGVAESIDDDGCLIILDNTGIRRKIVTGDVSLRLEQ